MNERQNDYRNRGLMTHKTTTVTLRPRVNNVPGAVKNEPPEQKEGGVTRGMATGSTSGVALSSAEAEVLKLALEYLVNNMDTSSLLPAALSRGLIREQQKAECANPYQKAEKFLEYLLREVNGDNKKFHTFVQLLVDTGHSNLASRLRG